MRAYFIRRLLHSIPTLLGVILVTFILFQVVGGNPVYRLLGKNASAPEIARLTHQLGLDQPLPLRFWHYVLSVARFDFGRSWETHQRISEMIRDGLWPSLSLALPAFLLTTVIAIGFALLAAAWRCTWKDRTLVIFSVLGMSVSILVFIIGAQYLLAFRWNAFPISGWEAGWKGLPYLALPIALWIISQLGSDVRFYRAVFIEEFGKEHVRAAEARGLGFRRILVWHVLRNGSVPILTQLAIGLPSLFTGSLLLENFFGIPGLGNLGVNAINASDLPVIQALTVVGAFLYMAGNILGDLLYAWADPRVRMT